MKPKINVLVKENGVVKAVTREMTDAEYAEHLAMTEMAESEVPADQIYGGGNDHSVCMNSKDGTDEVYASATNMEGLSFVSRETEIPLDGEVEE